MPTILVSGAANGLGLAFIHAYRKEDSNRIIAVDRAPLKKHFRGNVENYFCDVTSFASVNELAKRLKDTPIDLMIHSAGVRGLVPALEGEKPDNVAACETMDVMDLDTLMRTFQINAAGTFLLLRAIMPNLRQASIAKVIIMSSRMGSTGNNQVPNKDAGSAYAYRASKAALNAMVRSFAVDVPEVSFILCHPGRVETKLVKCKEEGAISAEDSVEGLQPLIEKWNKEDSGKYYDRFGAPIQW